MENKNCRDMLEEIRAELLMNLSRLQHAPSVQFQERPPNTELPEVDEDEEDKDERQHPDSNTNIDYRRNHAPSRVKVEYVESVANDKNDEGVDQLARKIQSTLEPTSSKGSMAAAEEDSMQRDELEKENSRTLIDEPTKIDQH